MDKIQIPQGDTVTLEIEYDATSFPAFDPEDYTNKLKLYKDKSKVASLVVDMASSSEGVMIFTLTKEQAESLATGDYYLKVTCESETEHYTLELDSDKLEVVF